MGKLDDKITRAAHIKKHTAGTSNEISFSVLDAAKAALDGDGSEEDGRGPLFGRIALFTLPGRRKKPVATPTKARGLHLSTGDFVSVDDEDGATSFGVIAADAVSTAAGRADADAIGAKRSSLPLPSGASSSASASPRTPEQEIARRKARRRLSRIVAIAVVSVASIGLLTAGGMYLYQDFQKHEESVSRLDEAIALVSQADETLLVLDDVVEHPFAEDADEKRAGLGGRADEARGLLAEADERARAVSVELRDAGAKEAANQAVAAIAARQTLLETGSQIAAASASAQQAVQHIEAAWTHLLTADDLARDAAALVTETTAENVQASKDKTNEALAELESARAELESARQAFDAVDASSLAAYVDKREEALEHAILSDDAFLARDRNEAASQNDAYNVADAEAAELANTLPTDLPSLVHDAYEDAVSDLSKAYSTARSQAGTADAFIRDYLGAESK